MYDLQQMRDSLPFCEHVEFEAHTDDNTGDQKVVVKCHFPHGFTGDITCPDMPATTEDVIKLVTAAVVQCLYKTAYRGEFKKGKEARVITVDDDGNVTADTPRLDYNVSSAPSLRDVLMAVGDVVEVPGDARGLTSTSSNDKRKFKRAKPAKAVKPAVTVSASKLEAGRAAMARLKEATGD